MVDASVPIVSDTIALFGKNYESHPDVLRRVLKAERNKFEVKYRRALQLYTYEAMQGNTGLING